MEHHSCDRQNCLNWKNERCVLKDPENEKGTCLNYEDVMDFLRLKANAIKGSLG